MFPDVRLAVEPARAILLAAPGITLNVIGLPVPAAKPVAEAVIVIEPAWAPVTVKFATPAAEVTEVRPVTVPVPAVFVKVTLSVLSEPEVTTLLLRIFNRRSELPRRPRR